MNLAYSSILRHGKNLFRNNRCYYHGIACKMRYLTPSGSGVLFNKIIIGCYAAGSCEDDDKSFYLVDE